MTTKIYPEGRLNPDDEGAVEMAIALDRSKGVVVIEFAHRLKWVAFGAAHARWLGKKLLEHAQTLERAL